MLTSILRTIIIIFLLGVGAVLVSEGQGFWGGMIIIVAPLLSVPGFPSTVFVTLWTLCWFLLFGLVYLFIGWLTDDTYRDFVGYLESRWAWTAFVSGCSVWAALVVLWRKSGEDKAPSRPGLSPAERVRRIGSQENLDQQP